MTEAQAKARLERLLAADTEPKLSEDELADLLLLSRRADKYNRSIEAPNWQPTYNLNHGAAQGWRWKAGKIAGAYDFNADGASFTRSQGYTHCMEMAQHYATLSGISSIQMTTYYMSSAIPADVIGNL